MTSIAEVRERDKLIKERLDAALTPEQRLAVLRVGRLTVGISGAVSWLALAVGAMALYPWMHDVALLFVMVVGLVMGALGILRYALVSTKYSRRIRQLGDEILGAAPT